MIIAIRYWTARIAHKYCTDLSLAPMWWTGSLESRSSVDGCDRDHRVRMTLLLASCGCNRLTRGMIWITDGEFIDITVLPELSALN